MIDIHSLGLVVERPIREREEAGSRPAGVTLCTLFPRNTKKKKNFFLLSAGVRIWSV